MYPSVIHDGYGVFYGICHQQKILKYSFHNNIILIVYLFFVIYINKFITNDIHSALLLIPHFEAEGKCFKKLKVLLVLISFEIEISYCLS